MSNQLFKTPVPNDLVESYIREIAVNAQIIIY